MPQWLLQSKAYRCSRLPFARCSIARLGAHYSRSHIVAEWRAGCEQPSVRCPGAPTGCYCSDRSLWQLGCSTINPGNHFPVQSMNGSSLNYLIPSISANNRQRTAQQYQRACCLTWIDPRRGYSALIVAPGVHVVVAVLVVVAWIVTTG